MFLQLLIVKLNQLKFYIFYSWFLAKIFYVFFSYKFCSNKMPDKLLRFTLSARLPALFVVHDDIWHKTLWFTHTELQAIHLANDYVGYYIGFGCNWFE